MTSLATRPPAVDYRLVQDGNNIALTALLGDRVVAFDDQFCPLFKTRPHRPVELMQLVAAFHLKQLYAIANGDDAKRQDLIRDIPIGMVTLPDGSTI